MARESVGSRGSAVVLLLLLPLAAAVSYDNLSSAAASEVQPTAAAGPGAGIAGKRKVALLVGISRYSQASGWPSLHTETDVERIRAALEIQGFAPEDIHVLTDSEADREGIEAAFRKYLIEGAGKGAVAMFHYSGHGQRITDDDHDEVDGYDETLVPFDAPMKLAEGYDGGKHLRDDDFHDWIEELRRAIGADGDVLISLDSCFSGAATRGIARGSLEPLGLPQPPREGDLGVDRASGFVEGGARGVTPAAASTGGAGELAPYAVISAARHDELDFEARDEQGRPIGSLSLALGSALASAGAETTYQGLYREIRRIMADHVRNRPQLEGVPNSRVLDGELKSQQPFYEIASYDAASRVAVVKGGALAGLLEGSKVSLHPPETRDPERAPRLWARGEVRKARSLTSDVVFDRVAHGADVKRGWLFVTEPSFGKVRVRAYLGAGSWRAGLAEHLEARKLIEKVDTKEASDVVIEEGQHGVEVYQTTDDNPLLGPLPATDPRLAVMVRDVLEDFARNRWLRRVEARSRDIRVSVRIRPCRHEVKENDLGDAISSCGDDLERRTEGGDFELRVGDAFEMELVNEGVEDAYVAVLDLMPDGRIRLLYPGEEEMGKDNKLERGKRFTIPDPYLVGRPLGKEMLKLFATRKYVDFRPILSGNFVPEGSRGLLDEVLGGAFDGSRANPTVSSGPVSTDSLTFTVSKEEG